MALDEPGDTFLTDKIAVGDPPTGVDADNAPLPSPETMASTINASVQKVVTNSLATAYQGGMAPFGMTQYNVITADDPGVSVPTQIVYWIGNNRGTFTTPIPLFANGPAEPPNSNNARWTTSCVRRA